MAVITSDYCDFVTHSIEVLGYVPAGFPGRCILNPTNCVERATIGSKGDYYSLAASDVRIDDVTQFSDYTNRVRLLHSPLLFRSPNDMVSMLLQSLAQVIGHWVVE